MLPLCPIHLTYSFACNSPLKSDVSIADNGAKLTVIYLDKMNSSFPHPWGEKAISHYGLTLGGKREKEKQLV